MRNQQRFFLSIGIVTCLSLFWSGVVLAGQEGSEDYTKMSLKELMSLEIFTSASMLPTEIKKAPGTVYSFKRKDFVRLGVRTIDDLLAYVPGLQLNQYKKHHKSVWARGVINRYNNKTKLLVDGVPIQHVYYGDYFGGDNLPLEKVDKVEVIVGPASSLYGANAFAGVISITTREFTQQSQDSYMEATLDVGDNNRAGTNIFYNSNKLQGFISYLDQDAPFRNNRTSFVGDKSSQSLGEDYSNVYFKAQPMKGLQLSFNYQNNDTPFVFAPEQVNIHTESKSYNLSLHYETGDLDKGKLDAIAYYTDDQAKEDEYHRSTGIKAYSENRDSIYYGIKTTWFKKLLDVHTLSIGVEWQHDEARDMDNIRYWDHNNGFYTTAKYGSLLTRPNEQNDDYAVFFQDVWEINHDLTMTLGARYDDFEQFDNDINYRFALVYAPTEQQTLKLLWGTSVRKPTYREYLKVMEVDDGFEQPALDTEKMKTLELGYAYQWQNANLSVTAFYNEFRDFIKERTYKDTNNNKDEYFINDKNTWRMHGVEMLAEARPMDKVSLRASLGWLKARVNNIKINKVPYDDIPYLAEWDASLFADYQWRENHYIGVSVFYNSSKEDTNDTEYPDKLDEPDRFVTLDLYAHGQLIRNVSYQFGVKNLTDEKIYDPAGDFSDDYNTQRTDREVWAKLIYHYQF